MPTIRAPINFTNPDVTSSDAGNAFYNVNDLTVQDLGAWEFVQDVDGHIYGHVKIPTNLASGPNASFEYNVLANSNVNATSVFKISYLEVGDGDSATAAFSDVATKEIGISSPAWTQELATSAVITTPTAGNMLYVKFSHLGTSTGTFEDSVAANTVLPAGWLKIDVS